MKMSGRGKAGQAVSRSLEEAVADLWTERADADIFNTPLHVVSGGGVAVGLPFLSRAQSMLPIVAFRDPMAAGLDRLNVARTGWRIVNLLASIAVESPELDATIEGTLARAWAPRSKAAPDILRAMLILSAHDGQCAADAVAECVAAAGSNPYAVVGGALAALEGAKEVLPRIGATLGAMRRARDLAPHVKTLDGFGRGDAPARTLLAMLPSSRERDFVERVIEARGKAPTLDFALVAAERCLSLPAGSALTVYGIGRTITWIRLAIQQFGTLRPSP